MLRLDHLAIVAPSLREGVEHVRACLDLDIPYGGAHREMGTHNHLLRLGDESYLEVIAIDPDAGPPIARRWFGLDDTAAVRADWDAGRRLRAWVASTDDLDVVLARHGELLGREIRATRGDRSWLFALREDGALPAGGAAPCVIDWGERGSPAPGIPDLGARLKEFTIEHPDPTGLAALYQNLGVANPPRIERGASLRFRAEIQMPRGEKALF
jgi:hypothetical protein